MSGKQVATLVGHLPTTLLCSCFVQVLKFTPMGDTSNPGRKLYLLHLTSDIPKVYGIIVWRSGYENRYC